MARDACGNPVDMTIRGLLEKINGINETSGTCIKQVPS